MTDNVDLIVMGVEEGLSRAEMSNRLVKKFQQEAFTFEALLDGAFGESAPYAAQTEVERGLAEGGKEQLEELGLICSIVATGEKPEPLKIPPFSAVADNNDTDISDSSVTLDADVDADVDDRALATFKADANSKQASDQADEVAFEIDDDFETADSALASFKKDTGNSKKAGSNEVDFSDDLEAVGGDEPSIGLANAKLAKNNVAEIDDALAHDFSEQIEEVGADELSSGLKEAQQAKPDFNAEVAEVDFDDDDVSIGIREENPLTPEIVKSKLEEETTERNLNSFPKEDNNEGVDFSDELQTLSDEPKPEDSAETSATSTDKSDVPDALADSASGDLQAELVDPAPAAKVKKEAVELDDGGLSLSADNDTPLTTPKQKSNPENADDGGLSLSDDNTPADSQAVASVPSTESASGVTSTDTVDSIEQDASDSAEVTGLDSAIESGDAPSTESETGAGSVTAEANAQTDAPAVTDRAPENNVESQSNVEAPNASEQADVAKTLPAAASTTATAASSTTAPPTTTPDAPVKPAPAPARRPAATGGLVLPGQLSRSVVPEIVSEDALDDEANSTTPSAREVIPSQPPANEAFVSSEVAEPEDVDAKVASKAPGKSKKKLIAAVAGIAVLGGAGAFALTNAGSIPQLQGIQQSFSTSDSELTEVKDATGDVEKMRVEVAELKPGADLGSLSTGELLVNLSSNQSHGIVELEPYFLESRSEAKRGPRLGAAIPAESERMVRNREPHPADKYFDEWSNREADLSLFLALLDNLIEKSDLKVAQQLSDRAKDKLFAVMSMQRLARAYSDVGQNESVSRLMAMASRDTYAIKAPEERVLALADYAFTEQAIGLNEDAMDTFLKTSILARSLVKPETRTVGLSSAALYFHRSGRTRQALDLLEQSLQAGNELPDNTAARDLAYRYIALSEARMGLFNQALEHTKLIDDPIATVSAYHGIALAIESSGDNTGARKVLNMAYRAGSMVEDKEERSKLLSKVVLASEAK